MFKISFVRESRIQISCCLVRYSPVYNSFQYPRISSDVAGFLVGFFFSICLTADVISDLRDGDAERP